MEEQKKSREQILEETVKTLQKENEILKEKRDMYEEWWRKENAKNLELAEAIKSIGTLVNVIYNSAKQ